MKVLNPLMGTGASGSMQGFTVGWTRAGYAMRQKAQPPLRFRSTQMTNRSLLSYLAVYWSTITQPQRDGWGVWATSHPQPNGFGGTFVMSGFNAFIYANQCRLSEFPAGGVYADAPTLPLAATIKTLSPGAGVVSGTISLAFTLYGTGLVTDSIQICTSSPHIGYGCFDGLKGWKKVMSVAGNAVIGTITGQIPGAVYGVRIRYVQADGQRSPWMVKAFTSHV